MPPTLLVIYDTPYPDISFAARFHYAAATSSMPPVAAIVDDRRRLAFFFTSRSAFRPTGRWFDAAISLFRRAVCRQFACRFD